MAQQQRKGKRPITLEDVFGTPEDKQAQRRYVADLRRRFRHYKGTIEETQAALKKDLGDRLLSDYVMEGHGHVWKDDHWE